MNAASPATTDSTGPQRQQLRVLVVEDSAVDAEVVVRELGRAGFDVDWMRAETEDAFLNALDTLPELILSDYSLPHFDGLRALDLFVERDLEIPFLLVSGTIGEERAAMVIQRGADDYLIKGNWARLGPAVRRALDIRRTRRERIDALESLRRSERAYREFVQALPVAVYTCDTSGRVTLFNDAATELWGKPPDGLDIYSNPLRLLDLHGHPVPAAQGPTVRVLRENTAIMGAEYLLERPDATRRHVLAYPHPLRSEDGTLTGAVSLVLDVTELRQAQNALVESELFAKATIDSVTAHICVLDETGRIIAVNRAWRAFYREAGLQQEGDAAFVGGNYLDACTNAYGEEAATAALMGDGIRQVIEGKVPMFALEYPCHGPAGERWFQSRVTRFHDASPYVVLAHEDITLRVAAELGVKRLNRVHRVMSQINGLIVRAPTRGELFGEACRIAVEDGEFRLAIIGMLDPATRQMSQVETYSRDHGLEAAIHELSASECVAKTPIVSQVMREGSAIFINDSENETMLRLGDAYQQSEVKSIAVLPLVVSGEAVGMLALYAGEKDFFHAEEIKLLTELANDVSFAIDHINQRERLEYLASYDPLTGLANRRLLLERLGRLRDGVEGDDHGLALFLLDLERFKNLNDSLGPDAGDALLLQVAEWLRQRLGADLRVARIGADQFAGVLLEGSEGAPPLRQLEALIEAFLAHPFKLNGNVYRIAAKFGLALRPERGVDVELLFSHAEAALKKAKAEGLRHMVHTQKMTEAVAQRVSRENQLRHALDNQEFILHYQPKVTLSTGKASSAEALIRWNDPRTGLVSPGEFIPILEETGLIYEVGLWALRQALDDHLRWRAAGLQALPIAVNVSPLQLRHPRFIAALEQIVAIHPHAAQGLEIEITEGSIMDDRKLGSSSLDAIRELGIRIAIDDFGTGFSSLAYLARLPIDTLKIDRMFVSGMAVDANGLALVSTIINLAHSLQLKVVAEGVEIEEEARLLKLLKCDEIQGFLVSKPLPVNVLERKYLAR